MSACPIWNKQHHIIIIIIIITLPQIYYKGVNKLKTAEEIISYLQAELDEAIEMHDNAKGKDPGQALAYMLKAYTISELLDEIK